MKNKNVKIFWLIGINLAYITVMSILSGTASENLSNQPIGYGFYIGWSSFAVMCLSVPMMVIIDLYALNKINKGGRKR